MSNIPDLLMEIEPFVTVSSSTRITSALNVLRKPSVNFVVVTDEGNPKALLVEDTLSGLAYEEKDTLEDILSRLPTSIVRIGDRSMDNNILLAAGSLLDSTNAPGLMIFGKKHVRGIIPRSALTVMLSNIYRSAEISYRMYVCRQSLPFEYSSPLEGDEPPLCPSYPLLHGRMELDV
jgi:CBS domain-containing protein